VRARKQAFGRDLRFEIVRTILSLREKGREAEPKIIKEARQRRSLRAKGGELKGHLRPFSFLLSKGMMQSTYPLKSEANMK
jgi:hypothetical protein